MDPQIQTLIPRTSQTRTHPIATLVLFLVLLSIASEYLYVRYRPVHSNPQPFALMGAQSGWYLQSDKELKSVGGPPGYGNAENVSIKEVGVSPLGTMALAQVPGKPGTVLGYVKGSVFTPRIADGVEKSNLVIRPDGFAAFAELGATTTIEIINVRNPSQAPYSAGAGKPLVALSSGKIVIVTSTGLKLLDPQTLVITDFVNMLPQTLPIRANVKPGAKFISSSSLVDPAKTSASGAYPLAVVSPDGKLAAFTNWASGGIDLYMLDGSANTATYRSSIHVASSTPVTALGFVNSHSLMVAMSSVGSAELFNLPSSPNAKVSSVATYELPSISAP